MIKKVIAFIGRREMLKNMAVLTGGTAIAQLISFAASPVLSRLFTEKQYGEYGIFTSIVSYLVVISCLRLEQAIVLPKEDDEARSIAQWSIKLNSIVSTLALLFSLSGILLFHFPPFLILLGPTVFFMGLINTFNYYSNRQKTYRLNSQSRIITSLFIAFVSVILGYLNYGSIGLIIGMFAGQVLGGAYLFKTLYREVYKSKQNLSWKELKKKYKQFIFINTPNALFDLTESAGVVILLGLFFDKSYVGAYFFAFRILKMPLSLLGTSIFQVFYKESSVLYADGKAIFPLFKKLMTQLSFLSFPFFLLLFIYGQELFVIVFGPEWIKAGEYAVLFAPWFWLNFIASTISCVPIIVNKQDVAFIVSVVNTSIRVLIILITGIYFTFEILIYSLAIIQPIIMLFNNSWYFYLAKKYGSKKIV
ncbi:MAG: oligosaccharide flippase family protein [Vicingaceae bacterium]